MWQTTKDGKRFWYGQWYYTARNEYQRNFVEIDGKTYNFDVNGYVTPGIHALYADWSAMQRGEMDVWEFDSDGALIRQITDKGIIDNQRGGLYLVEEDGYVHGGTAHVVKYNGDYYFVVYSGKLKQNSSQVITAANSGGLLEPGTYEFGADGKMIPPFTGVKAADDGILYYYKNGGICKEVYNNEFVKIGEEIYFVKWSGKVAANETRVVVKSQTNGLIEPGTYEFDAEGKIVPPFTGVKAADDGILYYYKNGGICKEVYNNEFVKIGEEIYFVKWSGKVAANETRVVVKSQTNGLIEPGTYEFDAEGKIVPPFTGVKAADDGTLYYYKNGGICKEVYNSELVKINGEIYLVKWSGKVAANETRVVPATKTNDLLEPGTYEFDAEGKIVPPFTGVKAADDGTLYYYKNGGICKAVYDTELVEVNGDIYLVNWSGKVVANETRFVPGSKTNDLKPSGFYIFGIDGKLMEGLQNISKKA